MAVKDRSVDATPMDLGELLQKLHLTIGQVAEMTGLSIRQISYWTGKGIIRASNPKRRLYDYLAIEKLLTIKHGLDDGMSLNDATLEAEEQINYKREHKNRWPSEQEAGGYLTSRLDELEKLTTSIRRQIQLFERQGRDEQKRVPAAKLEVVDLLAKYHFTRDKASRIADRLGRAIDLARMALDDLANESSVETTKCGSPEESKRVICKLPMGRERSHRRNNGSI